MTPIRQCVQDIINMAVTGLTLDELERMQQRVDQYLNSAPTEHRKAAEKTLLQFLRKASVEMTMPEPASALLDHAVMFVEGRISQRSA